MRNAIIRLEEPRDQQAVRNVNESAFGGTAEADLVASIHREGAAAVALVAELNEKLIGHILFSPVSVQPATTNQVVGLAPMSVLPEFQRRGIGTLLVREGLRRCRAAGVEAVVVVGHPEYYPRFGFRPAHEFGLRCEYDVPAEVFMVLELVPDSLRHVSGFVRYHDAFSRLEAR